MYRVQLQNFEGPLDLLLFFIKRDELDIYNIPIFYITEQFLEYIHFLDELDLQVASEFIYMASLLMSIKAKMMIPSEENNEEAEPEDDPRYELMQALLEYKRYKEVAVELTILDDKARKVFRRGFSEADLVEAEPDGEELLRPITLIELMTAYKQLLLQKSKKAVTHKVEQFETSIEKQMQYVAGKLKAFGRMSFTSVCSDLHTKMSIVVTFLAVLELIKERKLFLFIGESPLDFYLELSSESLNIDFEFDTYQ
jgi:segregation and condensation protein A